MLTVIQLPIGANHCASGHLVLASRYLFLVPVFLHLHFNFISCSKFLVFDVAPSIENFLPRSLFQNYKNSLNFCPSTVQLLNFNQFASTFISIGHLTGMFVILILSY